MKASFRHITRTRQWIATMLVAVSAATALPALAKPGDHGAGGHHGGFGGPGLFMGSPERVERVVDRMLDRVNGTEAQRAQIKQIAAQAAADLKTLRESGRALREQSLAVWTAPTVDAAAAESIRQQMLTQHDAVSRRVLQAMLDVSRVLTPEQRVKIADQMKRRHARMQERMNKQVQ